MFILKAFFVALFSLIFLFILVKLIGNKQISQMNMFDYINGITIGSIAAELASSEELKPFLILLVAMITYSIAAILISLGTDKSIKLRRILTGKAMILIENGNIYRKNLLKCKLDINEVLTLARNQGYFNISDISYAVMENNGKVSFLQKSTVRPANPSDFNLVPTEEKLLINVIIDGKLMPDNLKLSGNDEQWLKKQLKIQGYASYSDVILATVDWQNNASFFKFIDEVNDKNIFD